MKVASVSLRWDGSARAVLAAVASAILCSFGCGDGRRGVGAGASVARTATNAVYSRVGFFDVPESARDIRFWDDGNNRIVVFTVGEEEFLKQLGPVDLEEIVSEQWYYDAGFGDPEDPPYKHTCNRTTTNGLLFVTTEPDGGGVTILYDRSTGQAFIDIAEW